MKKILFLILFLIMIILYNKISVTQTIDTVSLYDISSSINVEHSIIKATTNIQKELDFNSELNKIISMYDIKINSIENQNNKLVANGIIDSNFVIITFIKDANYVQNNNRISITIIADYWKDMALYKRKLDNILTAYGYTSFETNYIGNIENSSNNYIDYIMNQFNTSNYKKSENDDSTFYLLNIDNVDEISFDNYNVLLTVRKDINNTKIVVSSINSMISY